ncbi:hypothetical protein JCM3765_006257 [Sporobolomyces pararoseus]
MHFLSTSLLLATLSQVALGAVYIVKPDGSDSFNAGKKITITWLDNDSKPAASEMGPSTLYIATGSTTAHTNLATIAHIADPSKQLEAPVEFDASWGPESDQYFMLLESDSAKDANNQPLQAFSARFQLNRMKGQFPAAALAQLEGSSSTPSSSSPSASQPSSLVPGSASSSGASSLSSIASVTSSDTAKNAAASPSKSPVAENSAQRNSLAIGGGIVLASLVGFMMI